MKKILIFSLAYYPHVGGAEVAIKEITDRIDPKDIEFHLICNRYDTLLPKTEKMGNVTVHRIGFGRKGADTTATSRFLFYLVKILYMPRATAKAVSLHRAHRFDGLWAMMAYMTFPISLMRLYGVRLPYILTLQEGDPFERVFGRWHIRAFLPLLRYGIRHASVVHAISTFLGKWARDAGFQGPVEIIPNGADVARFSRDVHTDAIPAIRNGLGVKREHTLLVHVGRLVEKNAVDDVIRALAYLPPDVVFVQIGTGPDESRLRALATSSGVSKRVRFLGFVDHEALPAYLHAADIFIRPSRSEGMGNAFIEAMAAGVPVIATQEGGIADFLFDPDDQKRNPDEKPTGRAALPNDPKGIARAVMLYLEDEATTRQIVENARTLVREKYNWDTIVRDMQSRVFSHL